MTELRLDPRNARKHSDRNKHQIRQSLETVGAGRSILADADGIVRAGNGVFAEWGDKPIKIVETDGKELVVVQRTDLRGQDAVRAAALDNLVADSSAFDYDAAILAEIARDDDVIRAIANEDAKLRELLRKENGNGEKQDAGELIDKAAQLQEKWQVRRGDVWQIGKHRLMCGDSTSKEDVERLMDGNRAQLCVTSPPYPGADMWDNSGTVKEIEQIGLNALRVAVNFIDDGCPILWNIANTPIGTMAGVIHTTTTTTKVAADELGLLCYGEIIWSKPVQHLTPLAFMMRPCVPNLIHEYVMIFYKGKRHQRESKSGLSDEAKTYRTSSVWAISPESAKELGHKAPFPVELPSRCVQLWSLEGDTVFDPFVGSGSTIVACQQNDRAGLGTFGLRLI